MIDRRQAVGLLSATILSATLPAAGLAGRRAFANEPAGARGGLERRGAMEEQLLYNLPLRAGTRPLFISQIFILGMTRLRLLRTATGVEQRNENRLGLGSVPLLGALTRQTYGPQDFTANNRIGASYAEGDSLFIYLFPEFSADPQARQIVFMNLSHSFMLRGSFEDNNLAAMRTLMPTFCAAQTTRRAIEARLSGKQQATVTVGIPDMDSLVMGNLVRHDPQTKSTIPALSDIPVLNRLFTGHLHSAADNQLMVVIRPSVAMGDGER